MSKPTERLYKRHVGRYLLSVVKRDFGGELGMGPESAILQDGGELVFISGGDYSGAFDTLHTEDGVVKWLERKALEH